MIVVDNLKSCPKCLGRGRDLIERLADYAHMAWSGWMKYLLSKCKPEERDGEIDAYATGALIIPKEFVERWTRQMNTPYRDLPDKEQESDRAEASKMIRLMGKAKE